MKRILDACCGSRMFWFDKSNQDVVFMDKRQLQTNLCDGRKLEVNPDIVADFRNMPFDDESFYMV
ncbi:TPA: SAM-dependent methyltransferase, partial [Staphylococcus pseudintermedius]|nr:SAM-dependent methyltransferase [Staphylococcus pseudintermedius]HAR6383507.1 SAM-dependent methyltransferase [Staphylococcus pseudintermedius]